jgi:hypothetical protein
MRQVAILALGVFALYIAVVTAPDARLNGVEVLEDSLGM